MTNENVTVNREYKDRLFKLVFREKKDLLELYNAVNHTDYDNPEEIEVNTLEEVIAMLLTEYDEELHIRSEREIALEEGEKRGIEIGMDIGIERGKKIGECTGREEGRKRKQEEVIRNMLKCGMPDADICVIVECDQSLVDEVRKRHIENDSN